MERGRLELTGIIITLTLVASATLARQDEGHERATEHIEKIKHASNEVKEARKRLDKAFEAYHETLRQGAEKRRSSYKELVKALERCEEKASELRKRYEEMDKKAEKFFKEWKDSLKDIKSGELKRRSEGRLEETRRRYRQVSSNWKSVGEDYKLVVAEMRDQVVYLGHDLNDDAAASVSEDAAALEGLRSELLRAMEGFDSTAGAYIEGLEPR